MTTSMSGCFSAKSLIASCVILVLVGLVHQENRIVTFSPSRSAVLPPHPERSSMIDRQTATTEAKGPLSRFITFLPQKGFAPSPFRPRPPKMVDPLHERSFPASVSPASVTPPFSRFSLNRK